MYLTSFWFDLSFLSFCMWVRSCSLFDITRSYLLFLSVIPRLCSLSCVFYRPFCLSDIGFARYFACFFTMETELLVCTALVVSINHWHKTVFKFCIIPCKIESTGFTFPQFPINTFYRILELLEVLLLFRSTEYEPGSYRSCTFLSHQFH